MRVSHITQKINGQDVLLHFIHLNTVRTYIVNIAAIAHIEINLDGETGGIRLLNGGWIPVQDKENLDDLKQFFQVPTCNSLLENTKVKI